MKPAAAVKSNNPFAGLLPFGKASASVDVEDEEEEEEDEEPEQKAKPGLFGFGGTTAVKKVAPVSKVCGCDLLCAGTMLGQGSDRSSLLNLAIPDRPLMNEDTVIPTQHRDASKVYILLHVSNMLLGAAFCAYILEL